MMRLGISSVFVAAILTTSVSGQSLACKQKSFEARVDGGERFKHAIGAGLELVLDPYMNHGGWELRVSPVGSDIDWTYPVNLPLSGEAQNLGSGWGVSAEDRLSRKASFHFVLNSSDFERYSKLAHDAMYSSSPSVNDDFFAALKKGIFGSVVLTHFQYETEGSPDSIKWVRFTARITVPESFEDHAAGWRSCPCNALH